MALPEQPGPPGGGGPPPGVGLGNLFNSGVVPGVNYRVEPGDCAPPLGEPFDVEVNYDQPMGQSVQVLKRGDKTTVLYSGDQPLDLHVMHYMANIERTAPLVEELKVAAETAAEAAAANRERTYQETWEAINKSRKARGLPELEPKAEPSA